MHFTLSNFSVLNFLLLIGLAVAQYIVYKILIKRLPEPVPQNIYFTIHNNTAEDKEIDIVKVELVTTESKATLYPSFVSGKKICPPYGTITWFLFGDDIKDSGINLKKLYSIRLCDSEDNYISLPKAEVQRIKNLG